MGDEVLQTHILTKFMAVGGGSVFTVFSRCFWDFVHLDVESLALKGVFIRQQLLVVEGWKCMRIHPSRC